MCTMKKLYYLVRLGSFIIATVNIFLEIFFFHNLSKIYFVQIQP